MLKYIIFIIIIILGLFLGFRYVIVPRAVEQSVANFHFEPSALPDSPNYYLATPQEPQGKDRSRTMQSPVFERDAQALARHIKVALKQQSRTHFLKELGPDAFLYVQYSGFWRFPDLIYVEVVKQENDKSSLIVFSRSLFGHYDFKVNEERVKALLYRIQAH